MSNNIPAKKIRLKRAYDSRASTDGTRILIDRLWPRGVTKAAAAIDQWVKDIAPSIELRKWRPAFVGPDLDVPGRSAGRPNSE